MLYLNASDVAAAIGLTKFKTPIEVAKQYYDRDNKSQPEIEATKYELPLDTTKDLIDKIGTQDDKQKLDTVTVQNTKKQDEIKNKSSVEKDAYDQQIKTLTFVESNTSDPAFLKRLSEEKQAVRHQYVEIINELEEESVKAQKEVDVQLGLLNKKMIEAEMSSVVLESSDDVSVRTERKKVAELKEILPENKKEIISERIHTYVNTERGKKGEESIINEYEKKSGVSVTDRNSQLYYITIEHFRIGGRIDGFDCSSNQLIEVKRRRNKFLGMPKYEKVQCELYLRMLGLTECVHIEEYNKEQREKEYISDDKLWLEIKTGLRGFRDLYDDYVLNAK